MKVKILYVINTGLAGGLQRHVLCLMETLKGVAETAVVINTMIEPRVIDMFVNKGMKVYWLHGKNGHDWRIAWRFHKVLRDFKPDIIHAHGLPIFCLFYLCLFDRKIPIIHSLHTPSIKPPWSQLLRLWLRDHRVDYWLPVSTSTWDALRKWHPKVKGEVFFNVVRLKDFPERILPDKLAAWKEKRPVVGMVGRKADVKDWPSFHKVEQLVKAKMPEVEFLNAGEDGICDGRAAILKMDLFILTSKYEQLPTTVLECFAMGTPVCGFLPDGGTRDVLAFSDGTVRETFIADRDCNKLAELVIDLLRDSHRRSLMAEDGWRIVNDHFSAEKLVPGKLMDIYRRFMPHD